MCGRKFSQRLYLRKHWKRSHFKEHGFLQRSNLICLKNESNLTCDFCGKVLKGWNAIQKHITNQHFKEAFRCDKCGKVLKTRRTISKHLNLHLRLTPYQCNKCNDVFVYKTELSRHFLKFHYEGEKFECECGKIHRSQNSVDTCRSSHRSSGFDCKVCSTYQKCNFYLDSNFVLSNRSANASIALTINSTVIGKDTTWKNMENCNLPA